MNAIMNKTGWSGPRCRCVSLLLLVTALWPAAVSAAENLSLPDRIVTEQGQTLSVEDQYIPGVVQAEMGWVPGSWFGVADDRLQEALKAQAVSARTFLLRFLNARGPAARVPVGPSFQAVNLNASARSRSAAVATRGQVMSYGGEVLNANYDSGAWPLDAAGRPFGPAAYGYRDRNGRVFASWDAMRTAYLADPQGYLRQFNASNNRFAWTQIFVTADNGGKRGAAVEPTVQFQRVPRNRGALGQYRALWLASRSGAQPVPPTPSPAPSGPLSRLQGKWTYIWRLENMYRGDQDKIIDALKRAKVRGVAIKVHNGLLDWDSPTLDAFLGRLKKQGILFMFWGYVYLNHNNPEGEAEAAGRMVKKYGSDVVAYLIDAEAEAKNQSANCKRFAARLKDLIGGICPIGLASYRYPSLHPELPWKELRAICDFDSPQVYYRNGDPVKNLEKSLREFQGLSPRLPYFPAGDMYAEHGLIPTPQTVTQYLQACKDNPAIPGTLMWVMDQLERVTDLWDAFSRFDWPLNSSPAPGPTASPAGLDYAQILRQFYGDDLSITAAAPLSPVVASGSTSGSSGSSGAPLQVTFTAAHPKNYSVWPAGRTIDLIVIHTIEGSVAGAINWFQLPPGPRPGGRGEQSGQLIGGSSAHYIVGFDGAITQMVAEKDVAWQAGNWSYNLRSIGIEHEGYAGRNLWTEDQYRASARLSARICRDFGIPVDRQHLIAHDDVPNQSHTDPGAYFDWNKYLSYVRQELGSVGGVAYLGSAQTVPSPVVTPTPQSQPTTQPLAAPVGLKAEPAAGNAVVLRWAASTGAAGYEAAIEIRSVGASAFSAYYTYAVTGTEKKFWPQDLTARYRFRVRAKLAAGFSPWSRDQEFDARPVATTQATSSTTTSTASAAPGRPVIVKPTTGQAITGSYVDLSWLTVSGATSYEVTLYHEQGGRWLKYYTWTTSATSKRVYPTLRGRRYALELRAQGAGGFGPLSLQRIFLFQ